MKNLLSLKFRLVIIICSMIVSILLVCTGIGYLTANAQEEEPTSTVIFTSYTTVMDVGEEFEFAALVTNEDGTTSTEVTWSSSNEDVLYIDEGLAIGADAGTATITATAPDGATADIDVLVSDEAILVTDVEVVPAHLELGVNWKMVVYVNVLPVDATDKNVVFSSSNPEILAVTADGYVTALAAGEAEIIATANDHMIKGTGTVEVIADIPEATLSNANPTLKIGDSIDLNMVLPEGVEIPEGVTPAYHWYTAEPDVASFDVNEDEIGTLRAWGFGSTEIYALVTYTVDDVTTRYGAMGRVLVTADYFYLTGLESTLTPDEEGESPWKTYTEAEAEAAGVLMTLVEGETDVYSITRTFWAYDGFQILHGGIDEAWTTKIDPYWYNAEGSSASYVANHHQFFSVNTYGVYTVTLDLSDGMAKVTIKMNDVFITEINPSIEANSSAVLQTVGDRATILVDLKPTNAEYDAETDEISVNFGADEEKDGADYLSVAAMTEPSKATDQETGEVTFSFTVTIELIKAYDGAANSAYNFPVTIAINENLKPEAASNSITLSVAPTDAVLPTTLAFEFPAYYYDVNNGGEAWQMSVKANVDDDATITSVEYYSDDIAVDPATGVVSVSAFGVYHLRAVAVGNPQLVDTATITVYSSQFYLAGILQGTAMWTALAPTATTIAGTEFANWGLTAVDSSYTKYEGTFKLNQNDMFSIVYLGMPGSWYGVIDAYNIDWEKSSKNYVSEHRWWNVAVNQSGMYKVSLDLNPELAEGETATGPKFTVQYMGEQFDTEHDLYLYLMRVGSSWLIGESDVANILAEAGPTTVDGENATTLTFTYDFAKMDPTWPVFQFAVTTTGTESGFVDAIWYGSGMVGVTISGNAYSASGAEGAFTNGGSGCEFWYVGEYRASMKVEFTVSFNQYGLITAIEMNWAE